MTLYDRLVGMLYDVHPYELNRSRWVCSQPMANWLADQCNVPRGAAEGAKLLGRPVRLGNDPGGLRLERQP